MSQNRETMTITKDDVAKIDAQDVEVKFTPPPPDERSDREKEIDGRLMELEGEIEALRQEQKTLVHERDELATKRSVLKKILAMSPAERKMAGIPEPQQITDAGGIESQEAAGVPGQ